MRRAAFLAGACALPFAGVARASSLLAPTPPMGWMSWNGFGPHINERLIREIADALVWTGLRDLGYRYVCLDDYWCVSRDANGDLIGDPKTFPSGIKALADYVHAKGLKLGVYSDAGPRTCAGNPASYEHEHRDAQTFAQWGVDYLKYDYCNAPPSRATAIRRYTAMERALRATGRPIVFAVCEWGERKPWTWAANVGAQLWRTTGDIRDTWEAPGNFIGIDQDIQLQAPIAGAARPGHWNDMDMLVVGLHGHTGYEMPRGVTFVPPSATEYRTQMSFWSLLASPLMVTCDIRTMDDTTRAILANPEVIAINQDALGREGRRIVDDGATQIWARPLANGDAAVALLNRDESARDIEVRWSRLGMSGDVRVRDLWRRRDLGVRRDGFRSVVHPHETVLLRVREEGSGTRRL